MIPKSPVLAAHTVEKGAVNRSCMADSTNLIKTRITRKTKFLFKSVTCYIFGCSGWICSWNFQWDWVVIRTWIRIAEPITGWNERYCYEYIVTGTLLLWNGHSNYAIAGKWTQAAYMPWNLFLSLHFLLLALRNRSPMGLCRWHQSYRYEHQIIVSFELNSVRWKLCQSTWNSLILHFSFLSFPVL